MLKRGEMGMTIESFGSVTNCIGKIEKLSLAYLFKRET